MKKEIADLWVAALRSGKYTQTRDRLHTRSGFCCLGVLCDISGTSEWVACENPNTYYYSDKSGRYGAVSVPSDIVKEWAGLGDCSPHFKTENKALSILLEDSESNAPFLVSLADLNDRKQLSFVEIAALIETHWEQL